MRTSILLITSNISDLMKFIFFKAVIISLIITLLSVNSYSQEIGKRTYNTVFTKSAPVIDGLINDECWNLVEWSGNFTQTQPVENKPPSQQTAFKILYDNDNLYIFIRSFDNEPEKISSIMSRRDNFSGDMVYVDIDSHFDKQTDY